MGLLSAAIFTGAGQGMQALSQGMFRQVEREAEDELWQKRTKMLAEIQRENARVQREDQAAFDDQRFPVRLDQERQTVAARGDAQTAAEVARLSNPDLTAAQSEAAARQQEQQIALLGQRRNDPRVQAAEKAEIDGKLALLREEAKIRGDAAIRVSNATRGPAGPSLAQQIAEKESIIGRPLSQQEREALVGLGRGGDKAQDLRIKLAEESFNKALELGEVKPEDRATFVAKQLESYSELSATRSAQELLRTERAGGNIARFVERMRSQGADDATLLGLGVTREELKNAAAGSAPQKTGKTSPSRASSEPVNATFGTPEYDQAVLERLGRSGMIPPGAFRQDFSRFNETR